MAGKVFISCGQRSPDERKIAEKVAEILRDEFGLTPYLAFKIQSLDDIMTITNELRSSDYYLFIDFMRNRDNPDDLGISLFTHQELALAHHLGFQNIIALQQKGAPLEGFIRYVLSNPDYFDGEEYLYDKIRRLTRDKQWSSDYSRNLIIQQLGFTELIQYGDHTGVFTEKTWQVRVFNKRPEEAARNTVCILDYIETTDQQRVVPFDRSYLKWAGQAGYERTILPNDFGDIDLFSLHTDSPGIFLHSLRDTPRTPIIQDNETYYFFFKLFSQGFPMIKFSVEINLNWQPVTPSEWRDRTNARLVS